MFHKTSELVKILLTAVLLLCGVDIFAQTITGVVVDQDQKPLPGVSVYLKGTTTGVMTDNQGKYSLNNRTGSKTIVFSCVGLKEHEEAVENRSVINVTMENDNNLLEETVVIGYQEVQRRDLMGSVSSADDRAVTALPSTNFTSALSGRLAGVNVTTTEGEPDADVQIRIRGVGSITQDASPLYIVDGFPVNSISDIAPQDIKSIDVLKDAFSTAIYGSRGAYGVVLITTKDGARGRVNVEYNGYGGAKVMANKNAYEMMNPYEYVASIYENCLIDNNKAQYTSRMGDFSDMGLYKYLPANNWRDRVFGRVGTTMNHHINVSGSSDKVKWSTSYGRMDEDAVMIRSSFSRNNFSFRTWYNPVKSLQFNMQVRYSSTNVSGSGANSVNDKGSEAGTGRLIQAMRYAPIAMNYLQDIEDYDIYSREFGANPVRYVEDNDTKRYREQWNASASMTWTIIPNLRLKIDGGVDNYSERNDRYYGLSSYYTREKANVQGFPNTDTKTNYGRTYRNANTLSYNFNNVIKDRKSRLDMLIGEEFSYRKTRVETVVAEGFPKFYDADLCYRYMGTASLISSATNDMGENEVMLSFFGRANYTYDRRYSVSGTLRADGSSKFAPGNQWGIFPSVAVSWTLSNESFLKRFREIDQIKLRYSFGTAGNNRIPAGQIRYVFHSGQDTRVYDMANFVLPDNIMPNPDLRWEKTLSHNLGIDFAFFKQRISGNFEFYNNTSKDLLLKFPVSGVGYTDQYRNIGTVRNRGVEGSFRFVLVEKKNFGLSLSANVAYNQNRVLSLGGVEEIQTESRFQSGMGWDYLVKAGDPLGVVYGYQSDGWYTVDEFLFSLTAAGDPKWTAIEPVRDGEGNIITPGTLDESGVLGTNAFRPGAPKFKDQNGDGVIDANDRVPIGHVLPDVTGGFSLTAQLFNIDFSAAFSFSTGNMLYNGDKLDLTQRGQQRYKNLLSICAPGNAWTNVDWNTGEFITDPDYLAEVNKDCKMYCPVSNTMFVSDYYLEDASFLRLNSLTLGYTFPRRLTQWVHISRMRIYATGSNLFCLTKYTGFDPEVNCRRNNPLTPGIDYSAYPKSISIVGGLNISF